jgi:hypothetical protein
MVDFNTWILPSLYVDQIKLQEDVTGMENHSYENKVCVFPNPATDQVTLQLDNTWSNQNNILVSVLVGSGQVVAKVAPDSNHRVVLNRGTLAAGVYFYRVEQEGKVLATGQLIFK